MLLTIRFTTNMTYTFHEDEEHDTYTYLVAFYVGALLQHSLYLSFTGFCLPLVRGSMFAHALAQLLPVALVCPKSELGFDLTLFSG